MKKFVFLFIASMLVSSAIFADKVIPFDQTPAAVQQFVNKHFGTLKVTYVEKDNHKYEIRLEDGTEIDFTKKGEWKEVDCKQMAVPQSILDLIPGQIQVYVDEKYPDRKISKINIERRKYEIELMGEPDIDLDFDKNGNFIKVDY